jgi:hypothetical protein
MTEHIDPERLIQMLKLPHIFDEAEWPHLRACPECMDTFVALARESRATSKDNSRFIRRSGQE